MGGKDSMVTQDKLRSLGQQLETMRQQLYMKQAEQNTLNALRELGLVNQEQFLLAEMELRREHGRAAARDPASCNRSGGCGARE
jgi:hypothetical protein